MQKLKNAEQGHMQSQKISRKTRRVCSLGSMVHPAGLVITASQLHLTGLLTHYGASGSSA